LNVDLIAGGSSGAELAGGPDTFGLYSYNNDGIDIDTTLANYIFQVVAHPANAAGGIAQFSEGSHPLIVFMNLRSTPLANPAFAANNPLDLVEVLPQPLQVRGYLRESMFVPGALGAQTLTSLGASNTWMTCVQPGDAIFTGVYTPYTNSASFSGALNGNWIWLLDTGLLNVFVPGGGLMLPESVTVDRQTNSVGMSVSVRAGVGGTATYYISNVGNPGSLMSSLSGSDVTFADMAAGAPAFLVNMTLPSTTSLGLQSPVTNKVVTDAGTINVLATANVFGPVLGSSITGGGNAGTILVGQSANLTFTAQNVEYIQDPLDTPLSLYDLNFLGVTITGPDAAYFSLQGATNGEVPPKYTALGLSTLQWTNHIVFTPNAARTYNATLSVTTDVNAPAGQAGLVYNFALSGTGVTPGVYVTQQPASTAAAPGATASFSVAGVVYGITNSITYQWKRGANPIPNATNATYTTGPVGSADNGASFSCVLTAGSYTAQSDAALLTVIDTATPYPQAVLADGPVLYYRMNEVAGTIAYDSSGNGLNGIYANVDHASSVTPMLGSSASFHGSSAQGNIAVPAYGNTPYITTEAWVKLNTWNTEYDVLDDYGLSGIFCDDSWVPGVFQMGALNPSQLEVNLWGAVGGSLGGPINVPDPAFTTGAWFHMATVYDSGVLFFYLNGNLVTAGFVGNVPVSVGPAHIGAWLGFDSNFYQYLDGQVDEMAVYAYPLTASQIAAHYQAAFATVSSPVLTFSLQGGVMQISWPDGSGFMLQHNSDLTNANGWSDLPAGNISPVSVNANLSQDFFRLRKL
jgi:hypothetical protein